MKKITLLLLVSLVVVGCAITPPERISGTDPIWWDNFTKGRYR